MKKAFLLSLLAITLNLSAQSTTYFAKPLELKTVPVSTSKSDSVVVWSNQILKHVPRSEFGGGDGGSQNLDQTLTNGNTAIDKTITLQTTNGESSTLSGTSLVLDKTPEESFHVENNRFRYLYESKGTSKENILNLPDIGGGEETLTTENSFKTVDGQSIVGSGNIAISGVIPNLTQVLTQGSTAVDKAIQILDASGEYSSNTNCYGVRAQFQNYVTYVQPTSVLVRNTGVADITIKPDSITFQRLRGNIVLTSPSDINDTYTQTLPAKSGTIALINDIKLESYRVDSLPVGVIGDQAYVIDAIAPTYLGALTGGGSIVCPVFYNGTTWVSH